ncbi:AEC family transporter [Oscillospiraceae bacterium 38-13]
MLESFLVALRVVVPMALLMAVGAGARKAGWMDRPTMRSMDRLTFRLFMPVLLFKNIYETDLPRSFAPREALFAVLALLVIFPAALLLPPRLVKDSGQAASMGQAMIRTNYILFGIAVAESIFGEGNIGPVALLGAIVVPMTNALSVIVLEVRRSGRAEPGKLALSILKNPMVLATLLALALLSLPFRLPDLLWGAVKDIAAVTTTLSFISLGVSLDLGEARANRRPLLIGTALRMVLVPLVFLPLSVALGFRDQSLCALMVLFAAPTAVASYPMAVAMGADGPLAGQLVCATTVLSVFTMFCYTFLFRSLGLL